MGLQLETLWHFGLVSFVAAGSPPSAVPRPRRGRRWEATRSTAQASRPVSFIIQAHFGSMAELLRPCPGQSLPRQGRLKASARGPTESGLIGGLIISEVLGPLQATCHGAALRIESAWLQT